MSQLVSWVLHQSHNQLIGFSLSFIILCSSSIFLWSRPSVFINTHTKMFTILISKHKKKKSRKIGGDETLESGSIKTNQSKFVWLNTKQCITINFVFFSFPFFSLVTFLYSIFKHKKENNEVEQMVYWLLMLYNCELLDFSFIFCWQCIPGGEWKKFVFFYPIKNIHTI